MADITKSLVDSFIPTVVAAQGLGTLKERRGISRFINTDFSEDLRSYGESVKVPFYGDLGTADDKAAGSDYTGTAPSDSDVTITLDKHKYKKVFIEDVARAEARPDIMQGYVNEAIFSVLKQVDVDLLTLGTSLSNTQAETSNHYDDIVTAKTTLIENNAPVDGEFIYAISPTKYADLLKDDDIARELNFGAGVAESGNLRQVSGVGIFPTQLIQTSGSPELKYNILMHRDALAMAVRPLPTDGNGMGLRQGVYNDPESGLSLRLSLGYDSAKGAMFVNAEMLYGVKILRDALAVAVTEAV